MLRINFPFRLFEAGERDCSSSEREMIADISSVLGDIAVAQKVYFIENI